MKKISWRQAQYIATMPPYRFAPGDVVETDDENADRLVRLSIADKAPADAKTVLDRRRAQLDERNAVTNAEAAEARIRQRAELQAELARLDREDAEMVTDGVVYQTDEGRYGAMITREDMGSDSGDDGASSPRRRRGQPADALDAAAEPAAK